MSTNSRDHDCESWARAPLPIHAQFRLENVPQRMGIRPPYAANPTASMRKFNPGGGSLKPMKNKEDVDGRDSALKARFALSPLSPSYSFFFVIARTDLG